MNTKSVCVVGCSSAGLGLSGFLLSNKVVEEVRLLELEKLNSDQLDVVSAKKGFDINGIYGEGFRALGYVGTNVEEAIKNCSTIFVTGSASHIEEYAEVITPHLGRDHKVFLLGASSLSSLRFRRSGAMHGGSTAYKIGETASLPFITRSTGLAGPILGRVTILAETPGVKFAAIPTIHTKEMFEVLSHYLPGLIKEAGSVIETTLENCMPIHHIPTLLLNAARLETTKEPFYLYREGITPSVARVIQALDEERLGIGRAFGYQLNPIIINVTKMEHITFATPAADIMTAYKGNILLSDILAPKTIKEAEFLLTDVKFGLVMFGILARCSGAKAEVIASMITLSKVLAPSLLSKPMDPLTGVLLESNSLPPAGYLKEMLDTLSFPNEFL